jgi:hypothetical protein
MKVEWFEVLVKSEKSAKRFFVKRCRKNGHILCQPGKPQARKKYSARPSIDTMFAVMHNKFFY